MLFKFTFQTDDFWFNNKVSINNLLAIDTILAGQSYDARLFLRRDDYELSICCRLSAARRGAHVAAAGALLGGRTLTTFSTLTPSIWWSKLEYILLIMIALILNPDL